jgi:hypothetical protein
MGHRMHRRIERTCDQCGHHYAALDNGKARFCGPACRTRHRIHSGIDHEDRTCVVCGATFRSNRYTRTQTCGRPCGFRLMSLRKRGGCRPV